jgi:F-type H+-transporting ATPase subunit delta
MTNSAAAMRYARALLEVSRRDADPERVEQELSGVADLVSSHPALASSLANPAIPPARKRALVTELVPLMGDISTVTRRLLELLADRDRLSILDDILSAYRSELLHFRGVAQVQITTASQLSPERVEVITRALGDATGRQVEVQTGVDADLLGGMVTQIGSTVFDGSIAGHLNRLRRQFLSDR